MPDPTGTYNDGGIKFVRQTVTANDDSSVSTTYIVKDGSLKAGTKRIVSDNENGVERSQAFMGQIRTGTLSLQFVNAADKPPALMQVIDIQDTTGTTVHVIVHDVSQKFGAGEEATVTLEIAEKKGT